MAFVPHKDADPLSALKAHESYESGQTPDHAGRQVPNRMRVGAKAASKGRVLLVDDDRSVRETLAELLDDSGFHPLQARDAIEAFQILRQDASIDVLITDLVMSGDDGIALIRQARALRDDLPAILLTGYAEQVSAVTTMAGASFHVMGKPVESELLVRQLELLIASRQT